MNAYRDWSTLREIDTRLGVAKGSAFRAFKRLDPPPAEPADCVVLTSPEDRAAIEALRTRGRIYAASVNVVLLSPAASSRVVEAVRAAATERR